jgi:hypothetical protein
MSSRRPYNELTLFSHVHKERTARRSSNKPVEEVKAIAALAGDTAAKVVISLGKGKQFYYALWVGRLQEQ